MPCPLGYTHPNLFFLYDTILIATLKQNICKGLKLLLQEQFKSSTRKQKAKQNKSSRGKLISVVSKENEPVRDERLIESINTLSGEMNARMSRETDAMMKLMHTQILTGINFAISEKTYTRNTKHGRKSAIHPPRH